MIVSDTLKSHITSEFNSWIEHQYAGKSFKERQEFGQFFTPPELTIQMIEKFDNLDGTILDPTCGCGGLLAACVIAGADPTKVYGIELDPDILKVCRERLSKLGVPEYNIHLGNALNDDCYDYFDESYSYNIEKDQVLIDGKPITVHKEPFGFGNN